MKNITVKILLEKNRRTIQIKKEKRTIVKS
jgi:hypothetical protein